MLPDRKAYEDKLDAQLAQWAADLGAFKAKVRHTEVDAMMKVDQTLASLQRNHDLAAIRLGHLKAVSDEFWESVKTSTETAWVGFKAAFHGAGHLG